MRLVAQPNVNTARLEAQVASDVRWLAAMRRYLGGIFAYVASLPWLHECPFLCDAIAHARAHTTSTLRRCIHDLRYIVTEHAHARIRITTGRTIERIHPGATRGQARRRRCNAAFYRSVTAGLFRDMHRGTLRQRVDRLRAILSNLEPLIARTIKRLLAIWRHVRTARHALVVTHEACESPLFVSASAFADTS